MDRTELFAGTLSIRAHTTFTNDHSDTSQFCKLILELLHTHGSCRSYRNHLVIILCTFDLTNDRAGMENRFVADIIRKLSSILNQTTVSNVTAGHQLSVQPYNIADFDISQVFCAYRCNKNFFISSDFDHDFSLRLY